MTEKIKTVVITGPTATGKTALAVELARRFDGEIVSIDSRQVCKSIAAWTSVPAKISANTAKSRTT